MTNEEMERKRLAENQLRQNAGSAALGTAANASAAPAYNSSAQGTSLAQGSANSAQGAKLAQASPTGGRNAGISGLTESTQAGLNQYGQSYTPSQTVTEAQNYLNGVINSRPGSFSSKYTKQIAELYDEIMNRPEFQYDVNEDPLFQQYKTQYMMNGRKAMQDVMGNAAAMTGGYGNSWGMTAGSQAYQNYLQALNDRLLELEQRSYDKYKYEGQELRNNLDMTTNLDSIDYGRYRDRVADWQADRSFAAGLYGQERNWDMSDWQNMQDYYQNMASMESGDYWTGQDLAEKQRQYDSDMSYKYAGLAEDARQADLLEAYRQAQLQEDIRQYDQNLAEKIREFDQAQALDQAQFDFQVRKYEDALAAALAEQTGGGGGGRNTKDQTVAQNAETMAYLPVQKVNAQGETNAGPLAKYTPAIPQSTLKQIVGQVKKLAKHEEQKQAQARQGTAAQIAITNAYNAMAKKKKPATEEQALQQLLSYKFN